MAALLDHFGLQLESQGWMADSRWQGSRSLGTTWSSEDGEARLMGALTVTELSTNLYEAMFRIVRAEGQPGAQ